MYLSNSGLEQRMCSSYHAGSCVNIPNLTNQNISYSKLEVSCLSLPEYSAVQNSSVIGHDVNQNIPQNVSAGLSYAHDKIGYLQGKKRYLSKDAEDSDKKKSYLPADRINIEVKFNPDNFLNPDAPLCQFIGNASEISSFVHEAFLKTTGNYLPEDITIEIISKQKMEAIPRFQKGTVGFCINRKGFGASRIVVMQGSLDRVMLTVGHEIGHSLSLPLKNNVEEEAKAFAFSLAWMKAIRENNIGNLAENILPKPAENGLHNVAFNFVIKLIKKGRDAIDVFMDLISRRIRFEV